MYGSEGPFCFHRNEKNKKIAEFRSRSPEEETGAKVEGLTAQPNRRLAARLMVKNSRAFIRAAE
jgi:hypothetical protein